MPSSIKSSSRSLVNTRKSTIGNAPSAQQIADMVDLREFDEQFALAYTSKNPSKQALGIFRFEKPLGSRMCEMVDPSSPREKVILKAIGAQKAGMCMFRGQDPKLKNSTPKEVTVKHKDFEATYPGRKTKVRAFGKDLRTGFSKEASEDSDSSSDSSSDDEAPKAAKQKSRKASAANVPALTDEQLLATVESE